MTPAAAIAMLDRQLAANGQDVVLQRLAAGAVAQAVTVRAFVRGFAADELTDSISQQDSKVILSPTGLDGWSSGAVSPLDPRVPIKGNRCVIDGRARAVEAGVAIRMAGEIVRIELAVKG